MSNVLDLFDQTVFVGERATGATNLLQCVWVYNRAIDIDGVRRFHQHLQQGRLSRRIERSPLPFGRHRWVSPSGQSELEIAAPRPRDEFDAWLDEQANTPLDAEHGPGWHLAVLPFTDGGAGVSLVISHCLTDGVGLCEALASAASGHHDPISWPAAGSRRRWQALREDARQTVRDIPAIGRAVVAAARFARRHRGGDNAATAPPVLPAREDEPITLPTATVFVDADEWDARAHVARGNQQHVARGTGGPASAASGSGHRRRLRRRDSARQRAHRRRYPCQCHHERRHHGRPRTRDNRPARDPRRNQASADPLPGRAKRAVSNCCPSFPFCRKGWSGDRSGFLPTARPASSHPTSVPSRRAPTDRTAPTPTTWS